MDEASLLRSIIERNKSGRAAASIRVARLTDSVAAGNYDEFERIISEYDDELRSGLSTGDDSSRKDDGSPETVVWSPGAENAGTGSPTPGANAES